METFTTGARRTEATVIGVPFAGTGVAIALLGSPWGVRLLGVVLAFVGAGIAWLYLHQKVVVADGEVTVYNFWRSHRMPISSIASVEVRFLPLDRVGAAYLQLNDGGGVHASGLSLGRVQGARTWKRGAAEVRRFAEFIDAASADSGDGGSSSAVLIRSSLAEDSSTPWYVWLVPIVGLAVVLAAAVANMPIGGIAAFVSLVGAGLMTSLSRRRR